MNRPQIFSITHYLAPIAGVILGSILTPSFADTTPDTEDLLNLSMEELMDMDVIVTIGTRAEGRSAGNLPVPVDVIPIAAMAGTGHTEVGRMLQILAPSFNFSSSSISDGTDALRPATLRGLGPDQTLVLINGKRRHQASLLHINTSVGRGTAGVDMNSIPAAAIERIEVLRDGAAAQYGSDAIAGVINVVLKDDNKAGVLSTSYGEYKEGDGTTTNVDLSKGFALGREGFLHATLNYRDRGRTDRSGRQGVCVYGGCSDSDGDGFEEVGDSREIDFDRDLFRIGDADSEQWAFVLNAQMDVGAGELYGFVTYSERDNQSGAFYRNPSSGFSAALQDGDNVIPDGFLPLINSRIKDRSINLGYRVDLGKGKKLDLSYTYGRNTIDYVVANSINYSFVNELRFGRGLSDTDIRNSIPRRAKAYGLELGLQTLNLDWTHTGADLGIAAGLEYRIDDYRVRPGEAYAYRDFDTDLDNDGASLYPQDADGGIQGFPGIGPASAVDEDRYVVSAYMDMEHQWGESLLVSAALRYDDYQDFGDSANFKLGANLALSSEVRLRAAVSTGFRAPSMQQQYFNNVGTQFVTNPDDPSGAQIPVQVGTFRNDSGLARLLGIPQLQEEESINLSLGVVYTPTESMSVTLDYYAIDIDDRIVISNRLDTDSDPSGSLGEALQTAGAGAAQFFLNGANTETRGVDLVMTYQDIRLGAGRLDLTLAANKTETEVVDLYTSAGGSLSQLDPTVVFSAQDISIIEEWQPQDRVSLTAAYQRQNWRVNLLLNRFGEYTVSDGGRQTYGAKLLTDINVSYQFNNGLSVSLGGVNIFDKLPDRNRIGNSRGGALETAVGGELIVNSPGVFTYSRRSAPFGFNGAYWYGKLSYRF